MLTPSAPLHAQDQPDDPRPEPAEPDPHDGRTVYLNDSFEAADALDQARDLVRDDKWHEAAELLQQTADRFGDRLVRVGTDHYVGIRRHINDLIARWPEEGLAAYRSLYEGKAKAHVSAGPVKRNLDALLPVFERFFCTAIGGELADTIGQLAIESADFALAEYVYRRALAHHPGAETNAPRWEAMLAIVAAMRGDPPEPPIAGATTTPVRTVRWMGQDRPLKEVLDSVRTEFAALRECGSPSDWPIFRGNPERNRMPAVRIEELGVLWRHSLAPTNGAREPAGPLRMFGEPETDESAGLIVQPVVSGGLVIIQHHRTITAVHRNTGEVAWRFQPDEIPKDPHDVFDDRAPGWDSPTVRDGRVYAALPGDAVPYFSYGSSRLPYELVCLELQTGSVHWRVDQHAFESRFAETHFDSAPIVRYGRLYIVGRRRRSFGFEDCYLYRFDAGTGRLQDRTHLGSASTGSFGTRPATRAAPALHGDTVYVCTNLGSVAAVSAHTGAVRWLRLYDRAATAEAGGSGRFSAPPAPWKFNPVIWSHGRIAALPTDAAQVLVLDASDGQRIATIPIDNLGRAEVLLGIHGDLVCAVGHEAACFDLQTKETRWSTPLGDGAKLYGRGLWTDTALLVPAQSGLFSFALTDGTRAVTPWNDDCGGGNLLALPDQLIVAGAESVCAHVRKAELWAALRRRMEHSPDDPLPALELAEVALRSHECQDALAAKPPKEPTLQPTRPQADGCSRMP